MVHSAASGLTQLLSTMPAASWRRGKTELLTYGPEGQRRGEGMRVFAASYAPRPRMLVFGAIDFAAPQLPASAASWDTSDRLRCAPGVCDPYEISRCRTK